MNATDRIKLPKWISEAEGLPRYATVEIDAESRTHFHIVAGHGTVDAPVHCFRCGLDLTHDVSRILGIGPICCEKLGISWVADTESPEAIERLRGELVRATTFEDKWVSKSRVLFDRNGEWVSRDIENALDYDGRFRTDLDLSRADVGSRVRVEISEWIAGEKGLPRVLEATIRKITMKAYQLDGVWLPADHLLRVELLESEGSTPEPELTIEEHQQDDRVTVEVEPWVAKAKPELGGQTTATGWLTRVAASGKAFQLELEGGKVWIPYSALKGLTVAVDERTDDEILAAAEELASSQAARAARTRADSTRKQTFARLLRTVGTEDGSDPHDELAPPQYREEDDGLPF